MNAPASFSRRVFLRRSSLGFGTLALTYLLQSEALRAAEGVVDLRPRPAHFPARAKAVILLFQNGGPSQLDLSTRSPNSRSATGKSTPRSSRASSPEARTTH